MELNPRRRFASAAAIVAFALLVLAPAASADLSPQLIAKHGWGDRQNSYSWSMTWFKGKLYVGTARSEFCVENATSQFYFPVQNFYRATPFYGVQCAADQWDLDLRAEIWQYTPQTGRWQMVYRSPADIPNPRARGKFIARDIGFRGMKVLRDKRGRQALFVSGVTANEYVPEIAKRHPPRLLRSYDGRHFHDISRPLVLRWSDFPAKRSMGYRGLTWWRGHLYILVSGALTGDGAVYRVDRPFARQGRFTRITPRDMHVFELATFDGDLYAGTGSWDVGYGVYKLHDPRGPHRWKPIVTHSAGSKKMISVVSMHVYRGRLYVGGVTWYNWEQGLPATELIRIDRRGRWEVVTGSPRRAPDGSMRYPISGLPDGFGNGFNAHFWRMVEQDGVLYVGTLDWSWFLQDSQHYAPEYSWLIDGVLTHEYGFDLWATCDGTSWFNVTRTGFDADPRFDFGVRGLASSPNGFYLGSANHANGTQVWHLKGSPCGKQGAGTAPVPRALMTDVQRDGTVVSWKGVAGPVRYRVERSAYVDLPLRGTKVPSVPVQEDPVVLGTTTRTYFVDRTRQPGRRYEYQVLARRPGGRWQPSNVQIVPDLRPPATAAQLGALLPGARAASANPAELVRLGRRSHDDRARQLAERLSRRLQYEHVAGGH